MKKFTRQREESLFKRILSIVTDPSAAITRPEVRRRVKLLNSLYVIYVLGVIATLAMVWAAPNDAVESRSIMLAVIACSLVLFISAFILGKTKFYPWSGIIFGLGVFLGCSMAILLMPTPVAVAHTLPYYCIPILLGVFVLPLRHVLMLLGIAVAFATSTVYLSGQMNHTQVGLTLIFILVVFLLLATGSILKHQDDLQIENERLQLFHAARMSTLGEMAGGVAHEINNPVAVIQLRISQTLRLLQQDPVNIEKVTEFLEGLKKTTSHIEKVIRGLRSFSRSGLSDPYEMTSIKSIVDETLGLCGEQLRNADIDVILAPFSEELKVECRQVQISQILLNLISNAKAAVTELAEKWIKLEVEDRDKEVTITVTDSGKGIPAQVAKHIFEPFYTTNQDKRGTGIGLSISQNLARNHFGRLFVDPKCPNTRFVLQLPKQQPSKNSSL